VCAFTVCRIAHSRFSLRRERTCTDAFTLAHRIAGFRSFGYVLACFFLFVALLLTFVFYYHYGTLYNFCFCSPPVYAPLFCLFATCASVRWKKIRSSGNRAFSMPALTCVFCWRSVPSPTVISNSCSQSEEKVTQKVGRAEPECRRINLFGYYQRISRIRRVLPWRWKAKLVPLAIYPPHFRSVYVWVRSRIQKQQRRATAASTSVTIKLYCKLQAEGEKKQNKKKNIYYY